MAARDWIPQQCFKRSRSVGSLIWGMVFYALEFIITLIVAWIVSFILGFIPIVGWILLIIFWIVFALDCVSIVLRIVFTFLIFFKAIKR